MLGQGPGPNGFVFFFFILPDKKILTHNYRSSELAENVFWLWQMDLDIWIEIIEKFPTEDYFQHSVKD